MSDIVRLLERAEEGCEGLKHGYYNLPCVHFLIFLCHDIKNKIDRLFLFIRTTAFGLFLKILQNYSLYSKKIELARCLIGRSPLGIELCSLFFLNAPWRIWNTRKAILRSLYCLLAGRDKSLYYLRPIIRLWNARSAIGTAFSLLERAKRSWNHPTGLRAL